jgi:hypothetical protein
VDKRTAKREAWWRGAGLIRAVLEGGFEWEQSYPDPQEAEAVRLALNEVIAEMERRGALPARRS